MIHWASKCSLLFVLMTALASAQTGEIQLNFENEKTGQPLTCRVKLTMNEKDQRIRGALFQSGWSLVESPLRYKGRVGDYRYEISHGPQFSRGSGGFTLDKKSEAVDVVKLPQHSDLENEGWFGGDLLSHVSAKESLEWLSAEDLQMAVVVQEKFEESIEPSQQAATRWVSSQSYHDARMNGGLTFHHWSAPAAVPDFVPASKLLELAKRQPQTHAEIQRLWARDVPLWLASGQIDSIQILSDHLTYDGDRAAKVETLAEVDDRLFRGPRGPGRMVEKLYWQVLEAGLRIPPSAGSGFGSNTSPLGYNRVYVHNGSTPELWWEGLRLGRSFVTSGPLLRAQVNGHAPGHIFKSTSQNPLEIEIALTLTVSDPVEYLDVVFNGRSIYQARLDEYARQGGRIPRQSIKESGWMVVRVVTERDYTYRMASSAPYFFEVDEQPRISQTAVEFFRRWLTKSAEQIAAEPEAVQAALQPYLTASQKFWDEQLKNATP